jgi:hypothetical protein
VWHATKQAVQGSIRSRSAVNDSSPERAVSTNQLAAPLTWSSFQQLQTYENGRRPHFAKPALPSRRRLSVPIDGLPRSASYCDAQDKLLVSNTSCTATKPRRWLRPIASSGPPALRHPAADPVSDRNFVRLGLTPCASTNHSFTAKTENPPRGR